MSPLRLNKPSLQLMIATILIILLKNICCFYFFTEEMSWNLNATLNWLWQYLYGAYAGYFSIVCILLAFICGIQQKNKQAFYFIALSILLIPFNSFAADYERMSGAYFSLPYTKTMRSDEILNWISIHLSFAVSFFFVIIFLLLQIVSWFSKSTLTLLYKIGIGLLLLCFAYAFCTERTLWDQDVQMQPNYSYLTKLCAQIIILSSIVIWLLVIHAYLTNTQQRIAPFIFIAVYCIVIIVFGFYMPERYKMFSYLARLIALLSLSGLVFLYIKHPQNVITIIVPVVSLFAGAALLAVYTYSGFFRDYLPSQMQFPPFKDAFVKAIVLVTLPVITAIAFRFLYLKREK